jgi:hypothetical protein
VLEATAATAISLLVIREFLALESGKLPACAARLVGWAAVPFLLAFAILFAGRILDYLR